jgi:hypothetical protein
MMVRTSQPVVFLGQIFTTWQQKNKNKNKNKFQTHMKD